MDELVANIKPARKEAATAGCCRSQLQGSRALLVESISSIMPAPVAVGGTASLLALPHLLN